MGWDFTVWALPISGLLIGIALGYIARRNHFCTLAALERHWYADDTSGSRSWALAGATALFASLIFQAIGLIDLSNSFYLTQSVPILGAITGGLMFGLGMALVGTCGFGAIITLGGGNLRALVVLVGIALAAISAQRGITAHFRQWAIDPVSFDMTFLGTTSPGTLLTIPKGFSTNLVIGLLITLTLLIWIFKDPAFRKNHTKMITGLLIGLLISFGWIATYTISQQSFDPVQLEAGSFVAPLGDTLLQLITVTGQAPDYGVGLMIGVLMGAAFAAWRSDNMRWEACDDARELSRHLIGAFLMGTGGVFALGCTIGQGVTAFSALAFSVPLSMLSIIIGARIGLSYLLEGSAFGFLKNLQQA